MVNTPTPATVLIVDDEELFRHSTADALSAACPSYTVLQAANGREALDRIDSASVDVVVTDIGMPVMDGLQLLTELQRRSFRGPILVVTAYGNPRVENQVSLEGAFTYLEKPVDLPDFIEAIRSAAEGEQSHVAGLTVAGFVQLLSVERKSCRLRITSEAEVGDLIFRDGQLVDARLGERRGLEAALELLTWDEGARLYLHTGVRTTHDTIDEPLTHLLLEAMKRKDESDREDQAAGGADNGPKPRASNVEFCLEQTMTIKGAIGAALVDWQQGQNLAQTGGGTLDLAIAGAGNTAVLQAKMKVLEAMGLKDSVEDILITLGRQYHLIHPVARHPGIFFYVALQRPGANPAMARLQLATISRDLVI